MNQTLKEAENPRGHRPPVVFGNFVFVLPVAPHHFSEAPRLRFPKTRKSSICLNSGKNPNFSESSYEAIIQEALKMVPVRVRGL